MKSAPATSLTTRNGRPTTTTRCGSTNMCGTATFGVPVKFKQLPNFSFDILPESMRGRGRGNGGGSDDDERCRQPLARTSPNYSRNAIDPPGFFFAAMTPKRTPKKSASKKKLEAALAMKTRTQLTARTTGLIRTDGSVGVTKTAEEGSEI
jgi:hypothetical protein